MTPQEQAAAKPNERAPRVFDVVRTNEGQLALVKDVSDIDGAASLMYFQAVPPGTKVAWWHIGAVEVLYNVGDLITSGELRAVKKVVLILRHTLSDGDAFTCPECEEHLNGWVDIVGGKHGPTESYCPGCGSEIVEDPIPSPSKGT